MPTPVSGLRRPKIHGALTGLALAACAAASSGCNRYALFRLAGYQQESFSNQADILFVIDNSNSMVEEATGLAENFGAFITELTEGEAARQTDGLADAVSNYVEYVQDRGAFVDYQFGITTTDVSDPDQNGLLLGATPIVAGVTIAS